MPIKLFFIKLETHGAYVKDGNAFIQQGGLNDTWGDQWFPIVSRDMDSARARANRMLAERAGATLKELGPDTML